MKTRSKVKNTTLIAVVIVVAAIIIGSMALFALQQPLPISLGVDDSRSMVMHIHPSITVVASAGEQIPLPTNIGINPSLWKERSLDQYGMQGMSPLHTHDSSGTIHVESNTERDFTLGEFLDIWGGLDPSKVIKVTSDGNEVNDYTSHLLEDGEKIIIEVAA